MSEVERRVAAWKAEGGRSEWTVDDEVDALLRGENPYSSVDDAPGPSEERGSSEGLESLKPIVCQRCHSLSTTGLTPLTSTTTGTPIPPSTFVSLITRLLTPAVIGQSVVVLMVDLFDFDASGPVKAINDIITSSGARHKVVLGVNKADLFPRDTVTTLRAETWVRRELEVAGVDVVGARQGTVKLMSAKTGEGVKSLMDKVMKDLGGRESVYLLGAANVGKSTLLNRIVAGRGGRGDRKAGRVKSTRNKFQADVMKMGGVTTSNLPGTTLGVIEVDLGEGKKLYDTPGLIVDGSFTKVCEGEELKMIVPSKR